MKNALFYIACIIVFGIWTSSIWYGMQENKFDEVARKYICHQVKESSDISYEAMTLKRACDDYFD